MIEYIVIPFNDKCDEELYKEFRLTAQAIEKVTKERFKYNALVDFARNRIVFYLTKWKSYQCYYTINQVNHLAEEFASKYLDGQEQLYRY